MISGLFVGIVFGILLQRTQFCFNSGFKNIFLQKNMRFPAALLIAVSIQSIGFFTLAQFELIKIPASQTPVLATLIGGFIFGFGMVIAGCCAAGGWFRSGEGGIAPFLVLLVFSLTVACGHMGALKWVLGALTKQSSQLTNFQDYFKISPWILVGILLVITAIMLKFSLSQKRFYPPPLHYRRKGLAHILLEKRLHPFLGGAMIGALGILAWYLSAQTGREYGYGVAIPSANVVEFLVTGQHRYINWGSLFVLGIFAGSFLSAVTAGEFELKSPEPKEYPKRVAGGILMGIGAILAGGCTVTNSLVATAYFSVQGWLATFMILLGCAVASKIFKPTQCGL